MNQAPILRRTAGTVLGEAEGHHPAGSQQTVGTWVSSMGNAAAWGVPVTGRSSWRSCDVRLVVCGTVAEWLTKGLHA